MTYRRKRNDIIQVYKIITGIDKLESNLFFTINNRENTRGHKLKLSKPRSNTTLILHSFSQRIINTWNNLPEQVIETDNINIFKDRLNTHWKEDPGKFDPMFHTYF